MLASETVPLVVVTSTASVLEVIAALVALEMFPEPARVIFPDAFIAPVGATDDPPLMIKVPDFALSEPAPLKVPFGVIATEEPSIAAETTTLFP